LLGVELSVSQARALAVVYSSQYELAGARPVAVHDRGSRVVKNRKGRGLTRDVSETKKKLVGVFTSCSNSQGSLCKNASAGAFCLYWAGSG
jgi:hypothetical protein